MLDASVYIVIGLFAGLVIWGLLAFAFLAIASAKRMNGHESVCAIGWQPRPTKMGEPPRSKISINAVDPTIIPRPQPVERGCGHL
ncbi:hypothetical protein [Achromobacter ruhlandii]|uniref:hypothetical protein n=1 Tax=Achromobacter ruhlandii TaxID=72557 RepID=UPI000C267D70|nr:hypothetical protein [Achromobacter ruhlandii]PJM69175.1 hypothetical protein CV751_15195 [Achromobacter ruhlandii]